MNTESIIIAILIIAAALVWPFVQSAAQNTLKQLEHNLPANMQAMLDLYAKMVVQSIEQELKTHTNEEKKAAALEMIRNLFLSAKLPVPNMAILDMAIESAVYLLNQEQGQLLPATLETTTK